MLDSGELNVFRDKLFIGEGAFPLRAYLLKPYQGSDLSTDEELFNKKVSSARNVVENAFGLMSSVFRIFLSTMSVDVQFAKMNTLTCCILHNVFKEMNKKIS